MASSTLSLELPGQEVSAPDVDTSPGGKSAGRWTQEEHKLFLQGLEKHQKQWKLIADLVKTRTVVQIRTHAQKYFQKLQKKNLKEGKLNSLSLSMDDADLLGSNKGLAPFSVDSKAASASRGSGDGAVTSSEGESDVERQHQRQYHDQNQYYQSQQYRNSQTDAKFQPLSTSSNPLTTSFDGKNRPIGNNPLLLKLAVNGTVATSTGSRAKNGTKSSKISNRHEAGSGSAPPSVARKRSREAKTGDGNVGKGSLNPLRSPKKKSNTGPNTPLSSPGGSLSRQASGHFGYGIPSMAHDPMPLQQSHMIDSSDLLFPLVDCDDAPTVDEHHLNAHHSELSALGMDGHADQLLDPNIVDLLDRIDWWQSDSVSGAHSRSPSPFTDTASSVSSSCGSSALDLHQAMVATRNVLLAAPTMGQRIVTMEGIAINNDGHATDGETSADGSKESNDGQTDTSNLPSTSHDTRSAFSSVINELKFVTKVAQCNSEDHDHISLYNLFQKTNDSATRRLPSMRTLARTLAENQNQYNQQSGIQYSSVAMAAATAARCRLNSVCSQASLDAEFSKFIIEDCGLMRDSTSSTGSDQNSSNDMVSREEVMNLDGLSRAEDSGNDSPQRRSLSAGVGSEPLLQNPNQLSMLHPMTSMPICPEASALEKSTKTPSSPPRKRGRPRKHPLPVPPAATTLPSSASYDAPTSNVADTSNNKVMDHSSNNCGTQMSCNDNEGSEAVMYNHHDPTLSHEMHIPAMIAFQQAVAEQQEHQQRKPCTFEHYGHTEHEHSGGGETDDFAIFDPFDSFDSAMLEMFD